MNTLQLLTGPTAQAIGWALLHLLWQATLVAGILAALLAILPRHAAAARYSASCGALAIVFAMFVATAVRSYDGGAPAPPAPTDGAITVSLRQLPIVIAASAVAPWQERATMAAAAAHHSLPFVVAIWLAGVAILSGRLASSWFQARALTTHGVRPASSDWQRIATRLSSSLGLNRAVTLLESAAVEVPSVLGTLRPVVLLPVSTLTGLTPEQIEMVLAHELAHIRRHDFLVNLLQAFVETLMFYHPAVWWMSRRVRVERENCCDDLALSVCGNPAQYARTLTRLEELRASAPAVAVAANGGSLIARIRRIAGERAESTALSSRAAAAIVTVAIVAFALAFPSAPALAQRDERDPEKVQPSQSKIDVVERAAANDVPAVDEDSADDDADDVDVDNDVDTDADADVDTDIDSDIDVDPDVDMDMDLDIDPDIDLDFAVPVPPVPPIHVSIRTPHPTPAIAPMPAIGPVPGVPAPAPTPMPAVRPTPGVPAIAPMPGIPVPPVAIAGMWSDGDDDDARPQRSRRDRKLSDDGKLSVDELIAMRAVGVTPEFVREMRAIFSDLTIGEVTGLGAVGVTADYVRGIRAAGIEVTSARAAQTLRAVDVTPDYVREMRDAGVSVTNAREATQMRAVGVTAAFVKRLAAAGYTNLSVRELTRMAAVGIDDAFLRDVEQYRNRK